MKRYVPAAVAPLFGQAAGAAAPAQGSRGPVAQHQDRFKGGDEADSGDEKDEKWKNNYVPYDEESKEKESS